MLITIINVSYVSLSFCLSETDEVRMNFDGWSSGRAVITAMQQHQAGTAVIQNEPHQTNRIQSNKTKAIRQKEPRHTNEMCGL